MATQFDERWVSLQINAVANQNIAPQPQVFFGGRNLKQILRINLLGNQYAVFTTIYPEKCQCDSCQVYKENLLAKTPPTLTA